MNNNIEENDYVIDNDGGLLVNPNFLDYFKELSIDKKINNNHLVYLFINKDIPGIKFYNLANPLQNDKTLKFITKKNLISEANWDFLVNHPNNSMLFRSDIGNIRIDTFIISKENMFKILNKIKKSKTDVINIFIKNKKKIDL